MSLTTTELIKLMEEHDSKAGEFERNLVRYTGVTRSELEEYNASSIIVLLGLIKLKQVTVDEILETCAKDLHK